MPCRRTGPSSTTWASSIHQTERHSLRPKPSKPKAFKIVFLAFLPPFILLLSGLGGNTPLDIEDGAAEDGRGGRFGSVAKEQRGLLLERAEEMSEDMHSQCTVSPTHLALPIRPVRWRGPNARLPAALLSRNNLSCKLLSV